MRETLEPATRRDDLKFRRLMEKLPAAAYTCDADGLITYYNRCAVELWGREPKLNDPVDRFCGSFKLFSASGSPINHDRCWMALALAENREFNGQEIIVERPDGWRRIVMANANPFHDESGRVIGAVNVLVDVTEERRAREDLHRTNQTLRALVQSSPLPIVVIDPDPPVVGLWNPAAERLFGWTAAEVIGRVIPVVPENNHEEFRTFREAVAQGHSFPGAQTERLRKDGALVPVSLSAAPLYDNSGRLEGILLLFADLTERKRTEDELREADRHKGEFLTMLAHELRNPLAPLRSGLQIMQMAPHDHSAVDQARAMMERQLGHMVRLIDDLLDLSRINHGKIELRRDRIDLADAIRDAVEASRPLIDSAGHELTVTLPPQAVGVDADRTRLAQVFANLLNNSAKYTPRGGHIRLILERHGSDAVVTVTDDGAGIPAKVLPRIFELFAQADRALERSRGGLGVGLSLVRGLVELHGGRVEARSDGPGKGSEFTVRLPVALTPAPNRADGDGRLTDSRGKSSYRILVVDDNEDSAVTMALMLKIMGHQTCTAFDGLEALTAAAEFRPEVILLDLGLPELNGFDTCRRLREQPWGRDAVILAMTGWGQEEDKRRSKEAGFNFHLVKPVDPAALEKLLAGLLVTPA